MVQLAEVTWTDAERLFSETDKDLQKLTLVEHEVYSNGIQKQVFDVQR